MVMSENSPVARYRARTPPVIGRRSRWVSPIECSVLTTTGAPARPPPAAVDLRPVQVRVHHVVAALADQPPQPGEQDSWRLLAISRLRTWTPSSRSMSATGPGLYSVTTSLSCREC